MTDAILSKDVSLDVVLSKDTIKRLAKDVKEIMKNPLTNHGIHYVHDTENILKGYALIIGSKDTPYENGSYIFELNYPADFPQSPPKVIYHTNDGKIRFNPNLYRNGKVCLSMLNTWRGEQWTPCQTISSILLTICSILDENPLLNEPNVRLTDKDIAPYNKIVTYGNYTVAIGDVLEKETYRNKFPELHEIACRHFLQNFDDIIGKLRTCRKYDRDVEVTEFYRMSVILCYKQTETRLHNIFDKLKIEYK